MDDYKIIVEQGNWGPVPCRCSYPDWNRGLVPSPDLAL